MRRLMRRYGAILIGGLAFGLCMTATARVSAQSTITVRVQWDPNAATDGVISYAVTVDGGAPLTLQASACTTVCEQPVTVSGGTHTFAVTATNQWGTSPATSMTVALTPPNAPKNLRIVK